MKLGEEKKIVPVMVSADYGAGVDADSINMKGFHHATFIITLGVIVGDAALTVHSGATDGVKSSALTFNYAWGGAAAGSANCDVLDAQAAAATVTLTGTNDGKMLIVEVDASDMDIANSEDWLTLAIDSAGTSGIAHIVAILEPRYTGNRSDSALV